MFKWLSKLGSENAGLGKMTRDLERMIQEGRHAFDAAANALLAGTDTEAVRDDVLRTDERIDSLQRQIRRQILVHGSVHGSGDLPELLILMSVTKDAERIGDYAKNLFSLASRHPITSACDHHADLLSVKARASALLAEAPAVYETQDRAGADQFMVDSEGVKAHCEKRMQLILSSETGSGQDAASLLAYRHMKRVVGHIQNIVTSVIVEAATPYF